MGVVVSIPTPTGIMMAALAATAALPAVAGAHADFHMNRAAAAVPSAMVDGGVAAPVVDMNSQFLGPDSFTAGGALHDSSFSGPYL
ncbi:hypothetical protein V8F20_010831 [Naviculisporaceae sp. PSN 640]